MNTRSVHPLRAILLLSAVAVLALAARTAYSADANISWTHPTQRVDNSPLALNEIKETQIDWAACATDNTFPATPLGTRAVPAPATTATITGLAYGTWCFRARTVDTLNEASVNTGTVWKQWLAPPKPPVIVTIATVAYEIKMSPFGEALLGRNVGTVALGVECAALPLVGNAFYPIPTSAVDFSKRPKSSIVVAQCATTS